MINKRIRVLVIIIVLFLGISLVALFTIHHNGKQGIVMAEIYRDNKLIQEINLSEVSEPYQMTVEYGEKDYNILEIRPGSVGIIEASCPDLLCKNMGFVDSSLMPITCLPNHLVIKVRTIQDSEITDGMTY